MKKRNQRAELGQFDIDELVSADGKNPAAWGEAISVAATRRGKPQSIGRRSGRPLTQVVRFPVSSSVISQIGYDRVSSTLLVEFRTGRVYEYSGVPLDVFDELKNARSVGEQFNREIRDRYQSQEIHVGGDKPGHEQR